MSETDAQDWIVARWGEAKRALLERYVALLLEENDRQNLIARSTLDIVWQRHILDSAQLVPLSDQAEDRDWVDIGSGAGLPGIVAAILQPRPVVLIEPRRRRAEFLEMVVQALDLSVKVIAQKVETVRRPTAAVVSARAVAPLSALFTGSAGFIDRSTIWLLPKGQSAQSELADVRQTWQGVFHVEQSITAKESQIVIARQVRRK